MIMIKKSNEEKERIYTLIVFLKIGITHEFTIFNFKFLIINQYTIDIFHMVCAIYFNFFASFFM